MWRGIVISGLLMLGAFAAQAFPQIVIYNYTTPPPTLEVVSIKPADRQEFTTPPESVQITFTQTIDPDNSDVKVFDPYNNQISADRQIPRDASMTAAITGRMYSGVYRIEWKAACACAGHASINGTSYFTVD